MLGCLKAEKRNDQFESAFTIDLTVVNEKPINLVTNGSKRFIRFLFAPNHFKGDQAYIRTLFFRWMKAQGTLPMPRKQTANVFYPRSRRPEQKSLKLTSYHQ